MAIRSDKYFTREPLEGMVVVCDLPITTGNSWGLWEHSGIYVGNGKIVSLDSDGYIRRESPSEFVQVRGNKMDKIWAMGGGASFYTDRGQETKLRAEMAWLMNEQRKYSILEGKHCHAFTAECITGENLNETPILPFTGLELHIKDCLIQEDDFEWYNWPSEYWTRWDW